MIKRIVIMCEWCLNQIVKEYEYGDHITWKRSKHSNYEKTPKLVVMHHPRKKQKFSLSYLLLKLSPSLLFFFLLEGWFRVNFDPKITHPSCFSLYPTWISDFTYFLFSFVCFCDFVVFERLCLFWFPVFVRCVFDFPS